MKSRSAVVNQRRTGRAAPGKASANVPRAVEVDELLVKMPTTLPRKVLGKAPGPKVLKSGDPYALLQ